MSFEDARFIREGRSLRDWLPDLLGPDPATRRRAENAVSAMWWGAPLADETAFLHLPADPTAHREAWGAAISRILADPSFAGTQFVEATLRRMKDDALEQDELFELEERWMDLDSDPGCPPLDPAVAKELEEKVKAGYANENAGRLANSLGTHTLHVVIEHAGPVLLRMPATVRAALRDNVCRQSIANALAKLGPAAVEFAPDLLSSNPSAASADEQVVAHPEALASIARHDQAIVRELLVRARSDNPQVAYSAARTLAGIGPEASRLVPSLVDELLAVFDDPDRAWVLLRCMGEIAPERRDVFDHVLAAARPRPPEMRPVEGHPQYTYDVNMHRRGSAIEALGHFRAFVDEAVPVLVDALSTFTEYDPDWEYGNGEHGRVVDALARLGPASAAAVPALLPRLRDSHGEINWRIIRFLAELGPAAHEALPALQRLWAELSQTGVAPAEADKPVDEHDDPLAWAIKQIDGAGDSR